MADPYLGMFESGSSPVEDMTALQGSPYGSFGNQTPQSSERMQHGGSFSSFPNQSQGSTEGNQQAQLQHFVDPSAMSATQGGFIKTSQKLQHFNDPLLSSSSGQPYTAMQGEQQQQFTQITARPAQQFGPRPSQMNVTWRGPQQPPSSTYPFMDQTRPPSSMQQGQFRGMFDYGYPRANSPRLQHFTDQQGLNNVNMSAVSQASRLGQQQVPSPNSNLGFSSPSPERSNSKQQQQENPQSQLRHYPNMMDLNQPQEIPSQSGIMPNHPSSVSGVKEGVQGKPGQNFPQFYGMKSNNMAMPQGSPGNSNMDPSMFNSFNNPQMQGMDRFMGMESNTDPMAQGTGYQYPPGYRMTGPQEMTQLKTSSLLMQMQRHQQQIQQLRDMPQQPQVQAQIQQLQHQFQQLCHVYMMQQQRLQQNYQMQSQNQMNYIRQQQQEKANRIAVEAMAKSAFQNEASAMMPQFPAFPSHLNRTKPGKGSNSTPGDKKMSQKASEPLQLGPSIVNKPVSRLASRPPATVLSKPSPMKNKKEDSDCEPSPPSSPSYGYEDDQGSSITRRSLRERKKRTYKDDFDYNLSDDDGGDREKTAKGQPAPIPTDVVGETAPPPPVVEEFEETMIVEKILAKRLREVKGEDGQESTQVEEFLVKYKNYSYLHAEWATAEKLARADKRIQMKIKRFKIKQQNMSPFFQEMEEEPFNPDYVEVDRVLDVSTGVDQHSGEPITHYLVKWRSLPYEESTWEIQADVDEAKIQAFYNLREMPPMHLRQFRPRPHPQEWIRLEASPVYKDGNTLREYQLEGVNWLSFCWCNRQNSILADEMGLGKTIQSISFCCEMQRLGVRGPFLVIAPLSTISNWQREYESWSDMNVVVYHGSASSRHLIQEYEFYYREEHGHPVPGIFKFQVLVTTYEIIIADNIQLSTVPWRAVIIDEAHRLKNRNCKLLEGLNNLKMEHRILLTGTPLQNNVDELFSLLNFLEPAQFPCQEAFLMEFGNLKTEGQVEKLKQLLKPMMLRRLKEDVEKNIAPKEETIIEVELTTVQKKFYRAIIERNFAFLARGAGSTSNVPNLMNTMMELRKCCNHPFLIDGAEDKIMSEYVNNRLDRHMFAMIEASGKLVLIHKLLPKLKIGGHKVLVFSQMVRCLDILEDYLVHMKYPYERIDGRVRGNLRQAAIDRFSKPDSDRFVFLLCTRAGGLGINLTAADTVIIFDSDWNPQNDLQAQARCHRIGQNKSVKVYRLITRNSYEREMFDRASLKLGLDKAVLQSMNTKENAGSNGSMSKKEIEDLLKKGAYGAIMEEDSDDGAKFCEEDIDQILERRTQIIQLESEGKGSTFAKASFVSARGEEDIDVDDPDFWKKWAKKADLDMDYINNKDDRIIDVPRQRKQTKRYGNEDGEFELSDLEEEEEVIVPRRAAWTRVECFRVEKNLLIYGWGRFKEILLHGRFKSKLAERDIECIARSILVYCLHHYHGDDKVKAFIRDIVKTSVSRDKISIDDRDKTYSPISTPSKGRGRGKKGKSSKNTNKSAIALIEVGADWKTVDPETIILDNGYKKHLQHHCNKILLRVRLLYYLKTEVIGNFAAVIREGSPSASDLDITIYNPEGDPPTDWWDVDCDKSLLVGVFKHGYERYNLLRADPTLCFLSKVGVSNSNADSAENDAIDQDERDEDDNNDDPDYHQPSNSKDDEDEEDDEDKDNVSAISSPATPRKGDKTTEGPETNSTGLRWPSASDLNTRLRRLVSGYQRVHRRQELKKAAAEKERERKEKFEEAIRQKEQKKLEMAQKWSKREEVDFYRTVSTFGVEYNGQEDTYDWTQFRRLARLDKKNDDRLTEYFKDFMAMCRRVCGRPLEEDRERGANVESISEERASRCLFRIQLLSRIREEVLVHENLEERLQLAQPSSDFPDWWIPGVHDMDLMKGVVKHGLVRTDYHVLNDPELCFAEILTKIATQNKTVDKTLDNTDQSSGAPAQSLPSLSNPNNTVESNNPDIKMNLPSISDTFKQNLDGTSLDPLIKSNVTEKDYDETTSDWLERKNSVDQPMNEQQDEDKSEFQDVEGSVQESVLSNVNSIGGIDEDSQMSETVEGQATGFGESTMIAVKWPKDRIVMQRLDQLCDCVINGVWPVKPKPEPVIPNQLGVASPSAGLSNMVDMDMMHPGMILDGAGKDDSSKAFQVQRVEGLKLSLKKHRRKRKKDGLLVKEGETDSIGSDGDLAPVHRKPRKYKKDASFWSENAINIDSSIPPDRQYLGDPLHVEKAPKKRRRKKEDKGEKPDKPSTAKKRGRKPKSDKLGSAGSHIDSGGTNLGEYLGHDWPGGGTLPSATVDINQKVPSLSDHQISPVSRITSGIHNPALGIHKEQTTMPVPSKNADTRNEGAKGNVMSLYGRASIEQQRSNPTTPTAATPTSSHQFFTVGYNNANYANTSKQEEHDSSRSSSPSSPSPSPNSFNSPGYPYDQVHRTGGYQQPYGPYGAVSYSGPYGMGVAAPNNQVSAKSPVVTSPSSVPSHFMFGNAYNPMYGGQPGYGSYPFMGLNNGSTGSSAGLSKDPGSQGEESSSPEAITKPFTAEGNANAQTKSPKTLLT